MLAFPNTTDVALQMEGLVERMQDEDSGVPVRTVKSFMSKIPSVFAGVELIAWMLKNLDIEETSELFAVQLRLCGQTVLFRRTSIKIN